MCGSSGAHAARPMGARHRRLVAGAVRGATHADGRRAERGRARHAGLRPPSLQPRIVEPAGLRALGSRGNQIAPGRPLRARTGRQPNGLLVADPDRRSCTRPSGSCRRCRRTTSHLHAPLLPGAQSVRHHQRDRCRRRRAPLSGRLRGFRALAASGQLPLRISYYLFRSVPAASWRLPALDAENKPHQRRPLRANGYVLEGGGEFLAWSAGDFENFLAPRPELADRPKWRDDLTGVARELSRRDGRSASTPPTTSR